jgi:aspartyl-tRNA(Asn)/glutamyl-tRNA(Gln) amidotransferase subunit A
MIYASLKELSDALGQKKISSVELTQEYLQRIERFRDLNAFITIDQDRSLAQAQYADQQRAAGHALPLTGIPLAHKDVFCTQDWLTTCASKMLANFTAPYNAHVVEQCKHAGFITLGKTNMDEFAMGSTNEHSYFGAVKNPWDPRAIAGGSSGGSAAAVAARLTPAATGTDTGGSIRQPAAFCGVSGIKPTYGTVSRYGMIAYASSLDQGGPLAHTAEDLALLLNTMTGHDPRDATSLPRDKEDYTRRLMQSIAGLKIGIPKEYFAQGLDSQVAHAIESALRVLTKLGAKWVEISLPKTEWAIPAYYAIAPAEASSNLSRFDGVRYGHRAQAYTDLHDMYERSRCEGFGDEVKRRILIGTYVLSHGYYDAYYLQAQKVRRLLAEDFQSAFTQCDLIAGPVAPTAAWDLGQKTEDPCALYLADIYTLGVNLAGLPGMSLPVGFTANRRPIGMQLIGNYFTEALLLNVAHQYQLQTDWHQQIPSGF